jgi:hypothetical protein
MVEVHLPMKTGDLYQKLTLKLTPDINPIWALCAEIQMLRENNQLPSSLPKEDETIAWRSLTS